MRFSLHDIHLGSRHTTDRSIPVVSDSHVEVPCIEVFKILIQGHKVLLFFSFCCMVALFNSPMPQEISKISKEGEYAIAHICEHSNQHGCFFKSFIKRSFVQSSIFCYMMNLAGSRDGGGAAPQVPVPHFPVLDAAVRPHRAAAAAASGLRPHPPGSTRQQDRLWRWRRSQLPLRTAPTSLLLGMTAVCSLLSLPLLTLLPSLSPSSSC